MGTILVVNSGSSSVKFQVFAITPDGGLERRLRGLVDGVGAHPRLRASDMNNKVLIERALDNKAVPDIQAALAAAGSWLRDELGIAPLAIGHRVVHGGPLFERPVKVDAGILAQLEKYIPLAPLHQPNSLAVIRSVHARFPNIPQVACFDTAFHRGHDELADHYAIPKDFYTEGVRRYGFHGLSYEYIASVLPDVAPEIASKRVIVAHLGSGASMCALRDGRSVENTMGFTALDGIPMGTRPGQIDPGVVLYLLSEKGMSLMEVQAFLYHDCGLKGLSGISSDMRELENSSDRLAQFAIDYFAYRVSLNTGMLAAAMQGLDGFVFTAGIGENSPKIRAAISSRLEWLGISLDPEANARNEQRISRPESRIPAYVTPTDEELMIARHTLKLLTQSSEPSLYGKAS